jgi:hypothetical protein
MESGIFSRLIIEPSHFRVMQSLFYSLGGRPEMHHAIIAAKEGARLAPAMALR